MFAICHSKHGHLAEGIDAVEVGFVDMADREGAVAEVVRFCRDNGVQGILTASEFLTPLAARACAELGLPGNTDGPTSPYRNKAAMVESFRQHGVSFPATFVVEDLAELLALVDGCSIGFPMVIKPAENAGSRGVNVVTDRAHLASAFARATAQDDAYDIPLDRRILTQELAVGEEFSVESVVSDGRVMHVCVTRKATTSGDFRVEIGHSLPASLPATDEQVILSEVTRAIVAVGIRNSVSHAEVMLEPGGACKVIEVAARVAGGRISRLVETALGVNLVGAAIDVALGRPIDIVNRRNRYAAIRFVVAERAGRVVSVGNLPDESRVEAVQLVRNVGSMVSGPESNRSRIGYVIVTGAGEDHVRARAEDLVRQIEVLLEPARGGGT